MALRTTVKVGLTVADTATWSFEIIERATVPESTSAEAPVWVLTVT